MAGYFLYHSIGTFPGKARLASGALTQFSDLWSAEDDGQWPAALGLRQKFMGAWQNLIDAPAGSLTSAENVTTALYSLVGALPETYLRGRRVLVAADCFPSLHFLLAGLAPRFGFTLDTVPLRAGETWVRDDDFIDRWQPDVGLALLTFVTSTTSHKCDIARLAAHGRASGTIVGVDVTQGIGVAPFSVQDPGIDFVVSTSLKWLCGAPGAGVLYVKPDLLPHCTPELRGWFSQDNPFSWDLDKFQYAADARRFDHGTPSILASVGSLPGLEWVSRTGVPAIQAHNRHLTSQIVARAQENGWTIASPVQDSERGGSVMLTLPESLDARAVVTALRSQKLYCDARGKTLRLSPGAVTSLEDIDALHAALERLIPARQ